MGFLKNAIKKGVSDGISSGIGKGIRDAVGGAVEKAVNPVADKWARQTASDLDSAAGQVQSGAKQTNGAFADLKRAAENFAGSVNQAAADTASAGSVRYADDGIPAEVKIRQVLAESFPQYQVSENVSPSTIGGQGRFMNYSFGIYSAGSPRLFIMLVGKTTCSTRLYRWSKEQAAKSGVPMINFVEHYPNNVNYIMERLQKYL